MLLSMYVLYSEERRYSETVDYTFANNLRDTSKDSAYAP